MALILVLHCANKSVIVADITLSGALGSAFSPKPHNMQVNCSGTLVRIVNLALSCQGARAGRRVMALEDRAVVDGQ